MSITMSPWTTVAIVSIFWIVYLVIRGTMSFWTAVEVVSFEGIALFVIWLYRGLLGVLGFFATRYVLLTLIVIVVYAILFGLIGNSFGLPYLFWSDDVLTRIEAATAVTLLLAVIWTVGFHLISQYMEMALPDPNPAEPPGPKGNPHTETESRVVPSKKAILQELKAFLRWQPTWLKNKAVRLVPSLRNVSIDDLDHDLILQLWALVCVMLPPFLLLLMAPTVFPRVFQAVPREIPTSLVYWVGKENNDTWQLIPRLIGGAPWMLGIGIGVLLTIFMLWGVSLLGNWFVSLVNRAPDLTDQANLKTFRLIWEFLKYTQQGGLVDRVFSFLIIRTIEKIEKKERWERPWWVIFGVLGACLFLAFLWSLGTRFSHVLLPRILPGYLLVVALIIWVCQLTPEEFPWIGPVTPQAWTSKDKVKRLFASRTFFLFFATVYVGLCIVWCIRDIPESNLLLLILASTILIILIVIRPLIIKRPLIIDHSSDIRAVATVLLLIMLLWVVCEWARWFLWRIRPSWLFHFRSSILQFRSQFLQFLAPAVSICLLLAVIAVAQALLVYYKKHLRVPLIALLVVLALITNFDAYKLRFPHMDGYDDAGGHLDYASFVEAHAQVKKTGDGASIRRTTDETTDDRALKGWLKALKEALKKKGMERPPKLAIVSTSGGAIRSAVWTAVVLERLEDELLDKTPEGTRFHDHVRLVTGASGGMVGSAYYVWSIHEKAPIKGLADRVPRDCLTSLAQQVVFGDIPAAFLPIVQVHDRGTELEATWKDLDKIHFQRDLGPRELEGSLPSIVFSPMMIEDGRRLLITNLNLGALITTRGDMIVDEETEKRYGNRFSVTSVPFFELFPNAAEFRLNTAVRMSATFPFVSPAVSLPTQPVRRVVDAGYYDNYGVNIAISWIYKHREWLMEHTSGVVLIQVRDSLGQEDRLKANDRADFWSDALRGLQFLTSPIDGALEARYASNMFRNDGEVSFLSDWFRRYNPNEPEFFTTVIFENPAHVSLSWYMTRGEVEEIKKGMGRLSSEITPAAEPGPDLTPAKQDASVQNASRLKKLRQWWAR